MNGDFNIGEICQQLLRKNTLRSNNNFYVNYQNSASAKPPYPGPSQAFERQIKINFSGIV